MLNNKNAISVSHITHRCFVLLLNESFSLSITVHFCFQLIEAVVLPITHKERFEALGIQPPKGKNQIIRTSLELVELFYC